MVDEIGPTRSCGHVRSKGVELVTHGPRTIQCCLRVRTRSARGLTLLRRRYPAPTNYKDFLSMLTRELSKCKVKRSDVLLFIKPLTDCTQLLHSPSSARVGSFPREPAAPASFVLLVQSSDTRSSEALATYRATITDTPKPVPRGAGGGMNAQFFAQKWPGNAGLDSRPSGPQGRATRSSNRRYRREPATTRLD